MNNPTVRTNIGVLVGVLAGVGLILSGTPGHSGDGNIGAIPAPPEIPFYPFPGDPLTQVEEGQLELEIGVVLLKIGSDIAKYPNPITYIGGNTIVVGGVMMSVHGFAQMIAGIMRGAPAPATIPGQVAKAFAENLAPLFGVPLG